MKLPEVESTWVCTVNYPEGADVKVGDLVKVVKHTDDVCIAYTHEGSTWYASQENWYKTFEQQKTPDTEASEVTEGYDLSSYVKVDEELHGLFTPITPETTTAIDEKQFYPEADIETETTKKLYDQVNSPSHYGQGSIEAIEYIEDFLTKEEYIGYLRGNCAKYLHRWRFKGKPVEDLRKAQVYLGWLIETVEKGK